MKKVFLMIAVCAVMVGCNGGGSVAEKGVVSDSVVVEEEDLFDVLTQKDAYKKDAEFGEFVAEYDGEKRVFFLSVLSDGGDVYSMDGKLEAVSGKRNEYRFETKGRFAEQKCEHRGTMSFSRIADGKVRIALDVEQYEEDYMPSEIVMRETTVEERREIDMERARYGY